MKMEEEEDREQSPTGSKRRRKVKPNAEKKFECKHEGCGKSYSRAEHLYRHDLNHKPKRLYYCQHPGCPRRFVRPDLCVRHEERHVSQGSQLQKRDASSQLPPSTEDKKRISVDTDAHRRLSLDQTPQPDRAIFRLDDHISPIVEGKPISLQKARTIDSIPSTSSASGDSRFQPPTPQTAYSASEQYFKFGSSYAVSPDQKPALPAPYRSEHRTSSFDSTVRTFGSTTLSPSLYRQGSFPTVRASIEEPGVSVATSQFGQVGSPDQTALSYDVLGSLALTTSPGLTSAGVNGTSNTSIANAIARSLEHYDATADSYALAGDTSSVDLTGGFTFPIWGMDGYNRSPIAGEGERFQAWLFDESIKTIGSYAPISDAIPGHIDIAATQMQTPGYPDRQFGPYFTPNPMSVINLIDSNTTTAQPCMSETKRAELLDIIDRQFKEREQDAVSPCKDRLLAGDYNNNNHILSSRMLHSYIGSYFYHQHTQLPILHIPTFDANKVPNLLLLTVIAIGAATLERAYGDITRPASEFANFLAWHVRWEIVRDESYRPPAKLWVFQTLILLEVYEKMYSTRALHERAHINHDTTLTLMRRGTSFIGKGGNDSPGSLREARTERSSGSASTPDLMPSDDTWRHWIRNEETRRIAFAAFVLDSIHATMFGHCAKMVAYEVRLPLPCDEALWSATSASEVARVQSTLQNNGIKPIMFLEGLKKTLRGERVRTNSFGRTILMSGLLSVNCLLNQRDLQVTALSVQNGTINPGRPWREGIMRAFDNWKQDFDDALLEAFPKDSAPHNITDPIVSRRLDGDNIFESRIVLHHLAHMASCVDIVDCQTFAGATRLLGRPIGPKESAQVREKMKKWVHTNNARDATFYAIKFLTQVLLPKTGAGAGGGMTILPLAFDEENRYLARDDFLMHRPWVLYFSSLVVWCYGYAREGPLRAEVIAEVAHEEPEAAQRDMKLFLERIGTVSEPKDLEGVQGINCCLGLLTVLRDTFKSTRWELTREAASLLGKCIKKLKQSA